MNDLISRQAAIDVADKFSDADGCNGSDVATDIISGLISLPSAQPDKTYEQGWREGREALEEEMWKDEIRYFGLSE